MKEQNYEKLLNIKTSGEEKWDEKFTHYHPYQPTSYEALDILFKKYKLESSDYIVDFGCGKGRLNFYINYFFKSYVTGIEMNEKFYKEAIDNKNNYVKKNRKDKEKINFLCCFAQEYEITNLDNKFYFFNPFSIQIFIKIIENILVSVEEYERNVQVILYYPSDDYIYYLENNTAFMLLDEVILSDLYKKDNRERFLIYQLSYT
ncbi:methyltransferase [Romboutsia maritimum]|uniref:Methyltransferase n=1 Tax=Romboutsia maritimum TaxID=2020948 RepID=A0A371IRL0_9FIRM|nr:methyltransferase [Romboutsia maritimum]RDY23120.1 methyltransferase [Romboutsia maritimum]